MSLGKILIIDDDLDILESTGELLKMVGYEIARAESIDEGLKSIESEHPDLIILDLVFPEEESLGFSVAKEIKLLYPTLPIFIITAINREFALGDDKNDPQIDEFLVKPVELQSLIEIIKKHLE